jgi:hypothetical protein
MWAEALHISLAMWTILKLCWEALKHQILKADNWNSKVVQPTRGHSVRLKANLVHAMHLILLCTLNVIAFQVHVPESFKRLPSALVFNLAILIMPEGCSGNMHASGSHCNIILQKIKHYFEDIILVFINVQERLEIALIIRKIKTI